VFFLEEERIVRVLSVSPYPFWDEEEWKGMPSIYLGQKGFVDAGHEVLYVFPSKKTKRYDYHGIKMHEFRLSFPRISPRHIWLLRLSLKIYWPVYVVAATIKALQLSKEFRPHVVYGHFFYGAPVAWVIGRVRKIPNITRMYGTFLFPWLHPKWKRLLKLEDILAFKIPCNYLIMTNDGTRGDDCAAILGTPKERFMFWRNGVDKEMYNPFFNKDQFKDALSIPSNHKTILALSRLVEWKRVDRLITAMPDILKEFPWATALIVGDGDDREKLEYLSKKLGIQDYVKFAGAVDHRDIGQFLNAADLFVSLYELSNVGNPILEALCCGKCIVSINNGATGRLIHNGETGVLLGETELHRLPETLASLLKNNKRRKSLAQEARKYAVEHLQTWPERIKMEVELIQQLVESRNTKIQNRS
jgi:glycosyltransferase involved in cell wall biosynthesis